MKLIPWKTASLLVVWGYVLCGCEDMQLKEEGRGPDIQVCVRDCTGEETSPTCHQAGWLCNQAVSSGKLKIDFGSVNLEGEVEIRRSVEIQNKGDAELTLQSIKFIQGDYFQFSLNLEQRPTPWTLQPEASTSFFVDYRPISGGEHLSLIEIASNDKDESNIGLALAGKALAAKVCVVPESLDFGNVLAGDSKIESFAIQNCGLADLAITNLTIGIDPMGSYAVFELPEFPKILTPGALLDVAIRFAPNESGSHHGSVHIYSNDPLSSTDGLTGKVDFFGASAPQACDLVVQPNPMQFGGVLKDASKTMDLTIANHGNANCTVDEVLISQNTPDAEFEILKKPEPGSSLEPGANPLLVQVQYTPRQLTSDQGILSVFGNDVVSEEIKVSLTGKGLEKAVCDLVITPSDIKFNLLKVNSSAGAIVTMRNVGYEECSIPVVKLLDSTIYPGNLSLASTPNLPIKIAPGATKEVEIEFAPDHPGEHKAFLWLEGTNDPDLKMGSVLQGCYRVFGGGGPKLGEACIPISAESAEAVLAVVPQKVDFGVVTIGCHSSEKILSAYNLGTVDLTVSSIYLDQSPGATAFQIRQAPMTPYKLSGGASLEIKLRYVPLLQQKHTANLILESDATNEHQTLVPLSGEGTHIQTQTDVFFQPARVMSDVLFVVDNSGSMSDEQQALADNFAAFIQWAIGLDVDFQLGVIATEVNEPYEGNPYQGTPPIEPGVLINAKDRPKILDNQTEDLIKAFADNAKIGTCCSDEQEAGLQAAHMALTPPLIDDPQKNGGFLREEAKLYVIILSDEQDQSRGSPAFYVDFFTSLKGYHNTEMVSVSAICGDKPNGCGGGSGGNGADSGSRYIEVAEQTGGIFQSICTDDWNQALQNLGMDAFTPIREFFLSRLADPATLSIQVDGQTISKASCEGCANGWTYYPEYNSIFFGDNVLPDKGDEIRVNYTAACLTD